MDGLILRLVGPMQSWPSANISPERVHTELFPTKSGLVGLLAAACGIKHGDAAALENIAQLRYCAAALRECHVRGEMVEKPHPIATTDFQTIKGALDMRGKPRKGSIIRQREFINDAAFMVVVNHPEAERLGRCLQKPIFTTYLGRKCCIPSVPIFMRCGNYADLVRELCKAKWHFMVYDSEDDALKNLGGYPRTICDEPQFIEGHARPLYHERTIYLKDNDLRTYEVERIDTKDLTCKHIGAAPAEFKELYEAGLDGEPNHYQLPVYPSKDPGGHEFGDWCEIDMSGFSENYRLARPARNFIYVINRGGRGRQWAHDVVHKYFGKVPWYTNGQMVVVYSSEPVRRFGDLEVIRYKPTGSDRLVRCTIDYIPKDYTAKRRRKMSGGRQQMTPERVQRLRESLGVDELRSLARRIVETMRGVRVFCWRFEFEKKASDLIPLLFKRHGGKFGAYGFGAIRVDINDD